MNAIEYSGKRETTSLTTALETVNTSKDPSPPLRQKGLCDTRYDIR